MSLLKVNVFHYGLLIWNTTYAVFYLVLGICYTSFWFGSIAGCYILIAMMRFSLLRYTAKHIPGEKIKDELVKYRNCGIIILLLNLTLSLMVFFMIYWNRTFIHHEIMAITMAVYTFGSLIISIINMAKRNKYNSPVYSAIQAINLASSGVSILILASTMLTAFSDERTSLRSRHIILGISGAIVSGFIISMAIYMILNSNKKIKQIENSEE